MRYPGGKNQAGTYQKIINIIPPHDMYFELFAGSAAIAQNLCASSFRLLIDRDIDQVLSLKKCMPPGTVILCADSIEWFKNSVDLINFLYDAGHGIFMYLDPPYPISSRRNQREIYKYELSDHKHLDLLISCSIAKFPIAISTYKNAIYADELSEWNCIKFYNQTRKGKALEYLYFNYDIPSKLHDYSFLGDTFRNREALKRSTNNFVSKFNAMGSLQQNLIRKLLNIN